MTEAEWLTCDDPRPMLRWLQDRGDDRGLRPFAVGCCRRIWDLLTDRRSRVAVQVAERYADGAATAEILGEARDDAFEAYANVFISNDHAAYAAHAAAFESTFNAAWFAADHAAVADKGPEDERREQASLLRHLLGNPFRPGDPVRIDPAWLAWNDGTVGKLARRIHDGYLFQYLPVLADALEEAGCSDAEILRHCREARGHLRSCWAVDALLRGGG